MNPKASGRRRPVLAALLLVGVVLLDPAPAMAIPPGATALRAATDSPADRQKALDRQLDDLRESLEGSADDLVAAAVDLRRAQSSLDAADAELESAHAAADAARKRDDALAERLQVARAAVGKAERELATRHDQEETTRRRLGDIAREAYLGSRVTGLSIALSAASPQQFADQVNVAGTALRQQNGALARLQVQQADTRARRSRLDAARDQVAGLKVESAQVVAQRRAAETRAARARATIRDSVALKIRAVHVIRARRAGERARVAALQKEQASLARLLRRRARHSAASSGGSSISGGGGGSGGGADGGSTLTYPVHAPITSGFGWRYHPILHYSRLHAGTDFGAPCGTPVRAAAGGTVVRAGRAGGFGNQVVVDHGRMKGKNLATSYNHLSRIVVHHGSVRRGQLIAYSGTTGLSTGCHLHFEVYVNGTHVNPMGWL